MNNQINSQNEAILKALKEHEKLTPLEMLNRFGTLRASARIWDLRNQGHPIKSQMVKVGEKRVAQYFLEN